MGHTSPFTATKVETVGVEIRALLLNAYDSRAHPDLSNAQWRVWGPDGLYVKHRGEGGDVFL